MMGKRRGVQKWLDRGASLHAVNKSGKTALMLGYNIEMLRWLITEGVALNVRDANGYTALHDAAVRHNPQVVDLFLNYGADVNARSNGGRTPLMLAAWPWPEDAEAVETLNLLLSGGADVNAVDQQGKTALIHLLEDEQHEAGCLEVVRLLLDHSAEVGVVDADGNTALDFAARRGLTDVVAVLEKQMR